MSAESISRQVLLQCLQASPDRIARNVYTLLSQAKPLIATSQPADAGPATATATATATADDDTTEVDSNHKSWCGAVEEGTVKASTMSEGPTQRRKRRRKEDAEVGFCFLQAVSTATACKDQKDLCMTLRKCIPMLPVSTCCIPKQAASTDHNYMQLIDICLSLIKIVLKG